MKFPDEQQARRKFVDECVAKFPDSGEPALADFKPRTFSWLIQRVIEDVQASPTTINQFGKSHLFGLRRLQRESIGKVVVDDLTKHDLIAFAKERRNGDAQREAVCAATVKQDISFLRGIISHAQDAFPDCENLTLAPFEGAKKYLVKNKLIGKSTPRTRLPMGDEIPRLLDDLAISDARKQTKIKMVPVVAFGLKSARRRSEVCRIVHGDVDYKTKVYCVRDLKHPTRKKGNDKWFTLWPELEQIIKMQPRLRPDDPTERIFPYNPESVTKRYIDSKKRLAIADLHLHDNRGAATSAWLLKLPRDRVRKLITGHDSEKAFDIYDRRSTVEIMQADAAVMNLLTPKPIPIGESACSS